MIGWQEDGQQFPGLQAGLQRNFGMRSLTPDLQLKTKTKRGGKFTIRQCLWDAQRPIVWRPDRAMMW